MDIERKNAISKIFNIKILREDWIKFEEILKNIGIKKLFHFTDKSNLESIKMGYPSFLELVKKKNKIEERKSLEESKVLILPLITSENYDISRKDVIKLHKNIINMLLKLGIKKKNIFLKVHPGRSNPRFYYEVYKENLLEENIYKDFSLVELINLSDFVIGGASTVIYEASFLDKPYFTYEITPRKYKLSDNVLHQKYINVATSINQLKDNIINGNDQNIKRFKDTNLYKYNYTDCVDILYKNINVEGIK